MNSDSAAQLRDLVENHLSRGKHSDVILAGVCVGLASVGSALSRAQERTPNWAAVCEELRSGIRDLRAVMPELDSSHDVASLKAFAERQLLFAEFLEREIVLGESDAP
jgi:hypothetical protein